MSISEKLEEEIKKALKGRDEIRLSTVRLIKAAVKNKEIDLRHPLTEAEFLTVLSGMAKRAQESIEQFKAGNRPDLVKKEEGQLEVIQTFLPQPIGDSELAGLIDQAVAQSGAKGPKDMGLVMKALKEKTAGRVDGSKLADAVKQKLSQIS